MRTLTAIAGLLLLSVLAGKQAFSQDLIFVKNDTISAKVLEIGHSFVKYQEEGSPIRWISKRKVLKFEYANGVVEDFGSRNPRKIRPLSLGIYASSEIYRDAFLFDLSANYFVRPYFSVNFSVGTIADAGIWTIGPRYYLNKTHSAKRLTPFIGLQAGQIFLIDKPEANLATVMLPLGVDYIFKSGFNVALECKPMLISEFEDAIILIGIKVGQNF